MAFGGNQCAARLAVSLCRGLSDDQGRINETGAPTDNDGSDFLGSGSYRDCSLRSIGTVQQLVRRDKFPKPRALSPRRVGWLVREIEERSEARPISDLLPPENTGARKGVD